MKTIFGKIFLSLMIIQYIVGSAGFTLHHCCCQKLYHTSFCLIEGFSPYKYHNCKKIEENKLAEGKLVFRQSHHCGDHIFSLEEEKYQNTDNLTSPNAYFSLLEVFLIAPSLMESLIDITPKESIYYQHTLKRRCIHTPEVLCTFII